MSLSPRLLFAALTAFAFLPACAQPAADTAESPLEMSAEEQEAMMMEAMAYGQPGPEHERLMAEAGNWTVAVRMVTPDGSWEESSGRSMKEVAFGGRYLVEHFAAEMGGMPFQGQLISTYDNFRQQYVAIWYDDMSTAPLMFIGQMEDGWLVYRVTVKDAYSPDGREFRHCSRELEDGSFQVQMFDTWPGAEEMMSMEMTYTRVD